MDILPGDSVDRILSEGMRVALPLGAALSDREIRPRHLYFLTEGIASIVFNSERGTSVELSTEGCEGLIGWINLLGPDVPNAGCAMQVSGGGYKVPIRAIQSAFDHDPAFRQRVLEYVQHQLVLANQVLACNRLHRAEARFSRWLLMVADRIQQDDLSMTQEFMSMMLGTRRTTVAEVAADLARAGAVEGRRGGLRIVNRAALEGRACECYRILRSRFDVLYKTSLLAEPQPGAAHDGRLPPPR